MTTNIQNNWHILILGAGSVGKRHFRNMAGMNCKLSGMDPNVDRLLEISKEIHLVFQFTSLEQIEKYWHKFDGVVVCSPPKFHQDQCIAAAENGLPILSEKPLTKTLVEAQKIANILNKIPNSQLLLGYTYRWWKPLKKFREELELGRIGKPLHAKFVMSAHLADWHPWESYQDFFMSSKDLGGGALIDESHFVDLMLWFFGMPESVIANIDKLSNLDIETDDNVDIIVRYKDGLRVSIHLDLFGRPHEKYISIAGEGSTLQWSFEPNIVQYSNKMESVWNKISFELERNDMFIEVEKEFLSILRGNTDISCTLDDGLNIMKILEACRLSSAEGRIVYLDEF